MLGTIKCINHPESGIEYVYYVLPYMDTKVWSTGYWAGNKSWQALNRDQLAKEFAYFMHGTSIYAMVSMEDLDQLRKIIKLSTKF